jgi:hypothetical protein
MIIAIILALGMLGGVPLASNPAAAQTLPAEPPPTAEDCGCGVPASPRGPR